MNARHEFKIALNPMDAAILQSRLRSVLRHDENADGTGQYRIRSLYFDTPRDKALREKIDGVNHREKYRLRLYNGNTGLIRLEKKCKRGNLCYKAAETVSCEEVQWLLAGEYGWMPNSSRPLVTELYSKIRGENLMPKTIVEYMREPFVFSAGNVRITLDKEIRTGILSKDFLTPTFPAVPAGDEIILLEVKYDAFIPEFITALLQLEDRHAAAFSKYAAARIYG